VTAARLELTRAQVLGHRRRVGALDERLPPGPESLRRAAWAGLADSMPRAAAMSIHARVADAGPATWEDPSLVQLWGPRFSVYVVSARDLPIFSLGRLPEDEPGRRRASDLADRLVAFLDGRRMSCEAAGEGLGCNANRLRYAAATGRILIRWEGARAPVIWTVPPPEMTAHEARLELARRFLHVFGPTTPAAFSHWAGIGRGDGPAAFRALGSEVLTVGTPIGEASILAVDEATFRAVPGPAAPARLLPSGDAYTLLWGADRELPLAEAGQRAALWTPRVWPGAVLVDGEIVGVWRRADARMTVATWRRLSARAREAVLAEAEALPLGLKRRIVVEWADG
jgi:DNA glycosylase AlkZ-like